MTFKEAVDNATTILSTTSESARLDAQLLLCYACNIEQTAIIAHPEKPLSKEQQNTFDSIIFRRSQGEPLAYITGNKEFWSLEFMVNKHVLIPRPETELLVELALHALPHYKSAKVLDLGTGSGAIAISIATQCVDCDVTASDISQHALEVAKNNALLHKTDMHFIQSNWFEKLSNVKFDIIICNPPYIANDDPYLESNVAIHEPTNALISSNNGLHDIELVISESIKHLSPNGILILEHGFQQQKHVKNLFDHYGFKITNTHVDLSGNDRAVSGRFI